MPDTVDAAEATMGVTFPAFPVARFRKVPTDPDDATLRAHAVYDVLLDDAVVGRVMRRRSGRTGRLAGRTHWRQQIAARDGSGQWTTDEAWFTTRRAAAAALLAQHQHAMTESAPR